MLAELASLFDSQYDFEMIMSDKIKHSKTKIKFFTRNVICSYGVWNVLIQKPLTINLLVH